MSAASVVAALRAQQEQRRRALLLQQHFDVTVAPKSNAEDASPLGTTPPDDAGGQGWAPSQRRAAVLLTQVVRPALEPLGGGAAQQVPWGTKCLPWAHLAAREKAIALAVESSDAAAAASPTAAAAASAAAVSGVTALGAGPTWPLAGPAQVWAADPQARAVMAAVAWARDGLLADVEAAAELPCRAAAVLAATADASAYAQARRLLDALDSEVKAEAESVEAGAWEETAAAAALRRWRQEQETELCALPPHFDSPDCSCWRCCYIPDEDGDSWSSAAARVQETVVAMRCLQADGEQDEADLEKAAARGRRILEHRRNRHEGTDAIVSGRMPIPSASAAWMFLAQLCPKHPEQLGFLQLSPADTSPLERQPPAGSDSTASPHGTAGGVVPPLSPAATWLARARQLAAVAWRRLAAAAAEEELQQEEPGAGSGAGGLSGPPEGPGPAWTVFREAMRGLLLLLGLRGKGTTVPAREQMTDPLDWPHDQEPPPDPLACAVLSVYFNFWQEFGVPRYKSLEAGSVDWPAFVPSVLQMYDMIRFVQLPLDLQDLDGQPLHAVAAAFDVVRQPPPRRLSDAALLPLLDTLEAPNLLIEQLSRAAVWKTATVGVLQQRVGTRGAAAAQAASAMAAAAAAAAARATATAAAATAGGSAGLSPRLRSGSRQQAEPPTGVEWECERVVVEAAEVLAHEALQGGPVNVGERLGLARDAEVALKVLAWMRDNDYTQSWTDEYDESEGLDEDEGESEGEEVEAEYVADDQPHVGLDAAPASSIAQRQRQQQWQQQQLDGGTGLGEHSTIEDEALDEWEEAADAGEEGGFESGAAAEATVSALRAGCSGGRSDGGANLPTWKALLRPQQLPVTEAAAGHSRATAAASSSPAASSNAVTAAAAASAGNSNGGTGNGAAVAGAAAVAAASTAGELQDWLLPLQAGLYDALYLSEAPAADEPADDLAAAAAAAAAATATATANAASAAAAAAAQLGSVSYALKILRTADAYGLLHPDPHVLATVAPLPVAASAQQQAACAASRAAAPPPLTALRQLLEKVHETHVALGQHMLRGVASAIVGAQAAVSNTATASGATATAAAATANVNAATLTRACQQTVSQHATAVICQGLRPALANMDACVLAGLEPSEGATVQKRAQQVQQGLLKAIEALGAAKRELDRVMASAGKEATAAPEAAVTAATAAAIAAATAAVDLVQELQPRLLEAHPRSWGQLAMMVRKGWTHNSILHLLLCVVWGLQLVQPLLPPVTAAGMPPREAWLGLAPLAAAGAVYAAEKQAARHRTAAGVAEAAPPGAPPTPHGPPVASAVPQYALAGSDAVRSGFCGAGVYAFLAYASLLHCPPLSELPTHPGWLGSLASWELRHPPQPQAQPGLQPPPPRALQLFPAATLHSAQQCLRGLARGPLALRAALCHYLHMRAFILATGLPADHPAHEADCYTRLAVLAAASACWQVAVRGDAVRQRLEQENGLEEAEGQEAAAAEEEAKALRFLTQVKSIRVQDEEDEQDDTQQQELQQQEQQLQQGWEGPDAAGMAAPHRRGEGEQDGEQEERQELQILDITTTSSAGVGGAASGGSSPDRPPGLSHRVRLVPRRAKRGPQPQPLLPPAAETQPTAAAGAALAATSTAPPPPVAAALTGAAVPPPLPPPPPPSRVLYCLGPGVPPLLMAQALMHGVLVCLRVTLPQPLMQRLLDAAAPPHSAATPGSQPPPPPPPPELDAQLLRQHLNEYRQRQLDVARLHGLPEVDLMVSGPAHATLALLYLQIHPAVIGSAPYWLGFQPEAVAAAPDPGGSKAAGSGPPAGPAAVLLRGLRPVLLPVQMHKEGHSFYKWNLIPRVTVNTTSKLADQARAVRDTLTAHRLAMVRVDGAAAMPRALHLTLLVRQALLSQGRDCYVGCSEVWPSGFDTRAQKRDGETDRNCGGSGYGRGGGRGSGSDSEGDDDMRSPCRRLTGAVVNLHEHLLQTRRFMRKKPLPGAPHRSGAAAATAAVSADDGADAADAEGLDWMDVATRDRCEERIMRDMHSVLQLLGGGDGGGDAAARSSVSAAAAPGLAEGSVAAAPSRAAAALGLVLCIVECEPDLEQLAALAPGAAAAAAAATAGGSGSGSSGSPARMAPGTIIFPPHGKPGAVAAAGAAGAAQYGQTGAAASASNTGAAAAARAKGAEKASGRGLGKKALQRALFDK